MTKRTIILILIFLYPFILFSQINFNTCENAYEICSKGTLTFNFEALESKPPEGVLPCLNDYENILWIKWKIKESGYLTFAIMPTGDFKEDIDFAVFKTYPNEHCKWKKLIRCMTSGLNYSHDNVNQNSFRCIGKMGLSVAEPKDQKDEKPGCGVSDNNFLAALDCKKGEEYLLAITQYDSAKTGYAVSFCGTAKLPCDTIFCEEYTERPASLPNIKSVSFLDHIEDNKLPFFIEGFEPQMIKASIENKAGYFFDIYRMDIISGKNNYEVPVGHLQDGEYIFKLEFNKQIVEGVFFKN